MSKASDAVLDFVTGASSKTQSDARSQAETPRTGLVANAGKLFDPKTAKVTLEAPLKITD